MWGKVACTHLVNLRYHKREVLQAMESKRRASVAFTFWMTCWQDGASAAFYGYKPQLYVSPHVPEVREIVLNMSA